MTTWTNDYGRMATDKWLHGQMATREMTTGQMATRQMGTGQMGTWTNGYTYVLLKLDCCVFVCPVCIKVIGE